MNTRNRKKTQTTSHNIALSEGFGESVRDIAPLGPAVFSGNFHIVHKIGLRIGLAGIPSDPDGWKRGLSHQQPEGPLGLPLHLIRRENPDIRMHVCSRSSYRTQSSTYASCCHIRKGTAQSVSGLSIESCVHHLYRPGKIPGP